MDYEKIRIIYTGQSLDIGGAEKVALDLMNNLDPQRFQIFLLIRDAGDGATKFDRTLLRAEQRGMRIVRKPARKLLSVNWMQRSKPGKIMGLVPFAIQVIREIIIEFRHYRAIRPHVIHLHKVLGFEPFVKKVIARAARIPVIITTYHQFPYSYSRSRYEPVRSFADRAFKRCLDFVILLGLQKIDDAMVATSPEEADAHVAAGVPVEKIVVISNGIELSPYENPPSRETLVTLKEDLGLPPGAFVFGHIGRLNVQKGQKYLIEAAASVLGEFPRAFLVLIGEGEDRAALQAQIATIGDESVRRRILLPGAKRDTEIALHHFMFDVFVLSSRFEGQGLVNMEAMAAGRPIIATRVGGVPSTVGAEAAILVPPENADALATAMRTLLLDAELRRRMGDAGRLRAFSRFKIEQTARNHEDLYSKLLQKRGALPLPMDARTAPRGESPVEAVDRLHKRGTSGGACI